MSDATPALQSMIRDGIARDGFAKIHLEKGDYYVQTIEIPQRCSVELFSKDHVRVIYSGKRNRPFFVLNEGSSLILKEKLELYYNTNNIQEAPKLMFRSASGARTEISKGVKVSLFSFSPNPSAQW